MEIHKESFCENFVAKLIHIAHFSLNVLISEKVCAAVSFNEHFEGNFPSEFASVNTNRAVLLTLTVGIVYNIIRRQIFYNIT